MENGAPIADEERTELKALMAADAMPAWLRKAYKSRAVAGLMGVINRDPAWAQVASTLLACALLNEIDLPDDAKGKIVDVQALWLGGDRLAAIAESGRWDGDLAIASMGARHE